MRTPPDRGSLSETKKALLARLLAQEGVVRRPDRPLAPRPDRSSAPLSFAQQRLWFLEQLDPGKPTYNLQYAARLRGALDIGALEQALAALVRRHDALRTCFAEEHGDAIQKVRPELEVPLRVESLESGGAAQAVALEQRIRQRIRDEAEQPFDLRTGPLIRVRLLALGRSEHVLLLAMHHLVTDGWSLGVLFEELRELYRGFLRGEPATLPELPIQYGDYVAWQRAWAEGPGLTEQLAWWKRQLTGAPTLLELPADRPRPAHPLVKGARYECVLPGSLAEQLTALGQKEGATLYMVLLAAFQVLLHRYTGQTDLLVGTPIAQRTRVETERLIGCFAGTLVLRGDLSGNPGFRQLLHRTREHCLGAYAHQDAPFERLVEELQPARSLSHSPLFQVMFVFQNEASELALEGASVARIPADTGTTTFDLTLTMEPGARGLHAIFHYSTELFDEATVAHMAGHLRTLLEGIAARPDARLGELPLLTAPERQQVLSGWNDTQRPVPLDEPLHHFITRQAARTPHAIAVTFEDQHLTYAQLAQRAHRLACRLRARGVREESRVGVCLERSLELVIALLATLEAGAAYVPLEPSYPQDRLAFMAADAQVHLLLFHGPTAAQVAALPAPRLRVDAPEDDEHDYEPEDTLDTRLGGDRLAYVIYTSGSTGRPKGAMNTHRAIVNRLLWMQHAFPLGPDDAVLQKTPVGFDVSVWELFWPLMTGARLVLARPGGHQDASYLARLIAAERITTLHFVPSMLQLFLDEPSLPGACASLRRVICSGEALPLELQRRFYQRLDAPLFNLYGPTEAAVDVSCWACERAPSRPCVPIGLPIANLQLFILDRWLQPVPVGVPGELFIGGLGLARGYLARPDLTAERFLPHPFAAPDAPGQRLYRTGDIARFLPDGAIEYLGRTDHQVKLRGFRIELGEIEAALAALPAVREALVVLGREPSGDGRLVAYLVADPAHPAAALEPSDLRAHLRRSLPEHMIPSAFVVLDRFPLSPNGKVDRAALPPPPRPRSAATATAVPASALEQAIAAVWRDVLGLPLVGLHDNFFDLGGHSLLLLRVHRALQGELGLAVSMMDLFRHPTVSALAGHLRTLGSPESEPAPLAQPPRQPAGDSARAHVAVVGMSVRLPGADTPETFWGNLAAGHESIRVFSDEELRGRGVEAAALEDPHYVKASASLPDIASFDAGLFGYTPREAELMDPQHRLFLECCWQALEHAGHWPAWFPGRIGVFAGSRVNNYLLFNVMPHAAVMSRGDVLSAISSNDQLATRAAYKLDLRGPSLTVQTACSTSLVAVHLACQSLLAGECDLVLAGGSSLDVPQHTGYGYTPGGILSPDGHCRPFGADARGTVPGNGVATVVLRRLDDALADGDTIYAVLLASAINNDGSAKVGYTAPSIDGQAQVIRDALTLAGIAADSIGLVEAHGTGTALGDPIEVAALTQAFRASTDRSGFCALGSVKSNLGHLDAAAGVVGLIKAVLALHHHQLPPSLHCQPPHPDIPFAASPFFLCDTLQPWPRATAPRRAAVSSFGIGGTNAHVILQEAPPPAPSTPCHRAEHLLLLSAHSEPALEQLCDAFSAWAHAHPDASLPDVAFTLQLGRAHLPHRRFLLASSLAQAASALDARHTQPVPSAVSPHKDAPVFFLFPGQGAQHPRMAAQLYASEPVFRELVDRCCSLLEPRLGLDLRALLFPPDGASLDNAAARLSQTALAQPALFVIEYCLARLWMHWGVRPAALLGHSIGQYTAACLAGVFALEDALALVCLRGALVQQQPPGAMLAVPLPETELLPLLDASLDLAAINTPALCVASGPRAAIAALSERLVSRGVQASALHTSHAFHSHMMEPALPAFSDALSRLPLKPPAIPLLCNVSGQLLSDADATSASYWARHLRAPVRFSDALHHLRSLAEHPLLLEVGPGAQLSSLARLHPATASALALSSLPHPKHAPGAATHLLALGQLWLHGAHVDWRALHSSARRRLVLPSLPFQRQRFWIDPPAALPRSASAPLSAASPPSSSAGSAGAPPRSAYPRPPLSTAYTPPRNDLEQLLVSSWEQLFGIAPIGIHDNFFELGGHSLLATQLCALLSQRLALQVSLPLLFDAPSPSLLSSALEALLMETADV